MAWRHGMQDVELVEDDRAVLDDLLPSPARVWAGRVAVRARAISRRLVPFWPVGLALAVLAVAASVGLHVVQQRQEAARLAALADVPGVLAPLDRSVHELWQSEVVIADVQLTAAGDALVATRTGPGNAVDMQALDPRTGDLMWSTVLREADQPLTSWGAAGCVLAEDDGLPVLACTVVDEWSTSPDSNGATVPTRAHLVVLDPRDGEVLAQRAVAPDASLGALDGDLLLASTGGGDRVRLERVHPVSGLVTWSFDDAIPVHPDAGYHGAPAWVQTVDGHVVLTSRATTWLLTPDGVPERGPVEADTVLVSGGRLLAQSYRWSDSGTTTYEILPDGSTGPEISLQPVWTTVDDGSVPGLLLAADASGELVGIDVTTGERRWTSSVRSVDSALVVDGHVVVGTPGHGVLGLDPQTGEIDWETEVARYDGFLSTDGRVVTTVDNVDLRDRRLVGLDLDDGRRAWEMPMGSDVEWMQVLDGRLYGQGQNGIVAIGTDG